ncbi:MAG: hypothetical protein R3351_00040, partial [Nitrospirales bacterium]|nr:hypothetical protein [Nitrospirales bacterium]
MIASLTLLNSRIATTGIMMCLCLLMGAGCYLIEKKPKSKKIVKTHSKVYAAVTPEEVFHASE